MKVEARPLVESALRSVSRTLPFWVEPAHMFSAVSHLPGAVLLESQSPGGRWSIICVEPFGGLSTVGGLTTVSLLDGVRSGAESPFDALRDVLRSYPLANDSVAQFSGGAMGYFGYGLRTCLEDVPASTMDDWNMSDCWMGLYDGAIVFDHRERAITINACVLSSEHDAERRMAGLEDLVRGGLEPNERVKRDNPCAASSSFTKAGYCAAVKRVKEYIAAGDVYQVNISQRYESPLGMSAWDIYLLLRERNPAPFAAYL
ncbi:MAG: chorismate-binding protein, partial [Armatimonadetes bacterium]|nr:chorismate-binding protein [Armatimonadota bacterium]